jgi:hypothetical protein
MNKKTQQIFLLGFLACFVSACASEDEILRRQENAFNLEGVYATTELDSDQAMLIEIVNENERHDILMTIERTSSFSEKELKLFERHSIDPVELTDSFGEKMILGEGAQNSAAGGEAISSDFGQSTDVSVHSKTKKTGDKSISYSFRAKIKKDDYVLKGRLTLVISTENQVSLPDGTTQTDVIYESTSLNLTASSEHGYYTQYFGMWQGQVFTDHPYLKQVNRLNIVLGVDQETFTVEPNLESVTYLDQNYEYITHSFDLADLNKVSIPTIQILYQNSDSDRILYVGQIWSLGELAGTILHISGDSQSPIGNFWFKKL